MLTVRYTILLTLAFSLIACSNNASHMPNVFQLPGAVVGSAIDNAVYNARRNKVTAFVKEHYSEIHQDVMAGGGQHLQQALLVAEIPETKHKQAIQQLISDQTLYFNPSEKVANQLMHGFAALYPVSQASKTINGFSYSQAHQLIENYAKTHSEALKVAIQQGQGDALLGLTKILNISNSATQQQFNASAKAAYVRIYIEPLVVFFMVQK